MCDVGRVAVKDCFKLLSFFTFIFAVLLQFPDSIKFISGLNTTVTGVFSDRAIAEKGAKIVTRPIWRYYKRILGIFSPRMRRNAYLRASRQKSDLSTRFSEHAFFTLLSFFYIYITLYSTEIKVWNISQKQNNGFKA